MRHEYDEHRSICVVDVAGFGNPDRTRPDHVTIRAGIHGGLRQACEKTGIPWDSCHVEVVGDSVLVLIPAALPKGVLAGLLPSALCTELRTHNDTHPPVQRIKLRMALHAGEITRDDLGVTGSAIVHAHRLLDAATFKKACAGSRAPLGMIVSAWFYAEVVRHRPEYEPGTYRPVHVAVKETDGIGWVRVLRT
jgi:class 3 adenylate cyclase